jgi:hypothetical protein
VLAVQRRTSARVDESVQRMSKMKVKVDRIEEQLLDMNRTMQTMQNTLNLLLNRDTIL